MENSSPPSWLPNFQEKYSEELKVVQANNFVIYKKPSCSLYQIFVNCFAVAMQKKRSGDSNSCEIERAYRNWKVNSDEAILKDLLSKALEVSKDSNRKQPTMKNFFKAKPRVEKQQPNRVQDNPPAGVEVERDQVKLAGGDQIRTDPVNADFAEPSSKLVQRIMTLFGVKSEQRAIEEISKNSILMETLKSVEKVWINFIRLSTEFDNISCYNWTNSVYRRRRQIIDEKWAEIKEAVKELAETSVIDPTTSRDLSIGELLQYSQFCLTRAAELTNKLIALSLQTVGDFQDINLRLRKRLSNKKIQVADEELIISSPRCGSSWAEALDSFNLPKKSGLFVISKEDLERVAHYFLYIRDKAIEFVLATDLLIYLAKPKTQLKAFTKILVENLPLISLKKGQTTILLDSCSFFSCGKKFASLIELVRSAGPVEENKWTRQFSEVEKESRCNRKVGPKVFAEKNPKAFEGIKDFCTNAGVSAHSRRREQTGNFGFSIPQLRRFVKEKFFPNNPGKAPSHSTLRRLFVAPSKNRRAASFYMAEIDARPVAASNDDVAGDVSKHSHVCFSTVKSVRELMAKHSQDTATLSVDDKAKVPLGCSAVSRLVKQKKFFAGEKPTLADHDIRSGFLLNPNGYMLLKSKNDDSEVQITSSARQMAEVVDDSYHEEPSVGLDSDESDPDDEILANKSLRLEVILESSSSEEDNELDNSLDLVINQELPNDDDSMDENSNRTTDKNSEEFEDLDHNSGRGNDENNKSSFSDSESTAYPRIRKRKRIISSSSSEVEDNEVEIENTLDEHAIMEIDNDHSTLEEMEGGNTDYQKDDDTMEENSNRTTDEKSEEFEDLDHNSGPGNDENNYSSCSDSEFTAYPRKRKRIISRSSSEVEDNEVEVENTLDEHAIMEIDNDHSTLEEMEGVNTDYQKDDDLKEDLGIYNVDVPEINNNPVPKRNEARKVVDELGREHFCYPCTGPFYVFLKSNTHKPSTIERHMNDIMNITQVSDDIKDKPVLSVIADDGGDYGIRCGATTHFLGRIFFELNLDALFFVKNAPGDSKHNPVEHGWSKITQLLSGVVIPAKLVGDDVVHTVEESQEDDNEVPEVIEASDEVFEQGINILTNLIKGECFDGFPIEPVPVHCSSDEVPIEGRNLDNNFYDDFEVVKNFYTKKMSREIIRKDPTSKVILKESLMIHKHLDRWLHGLFFRKCNRKLGDVLCEFCSDNPLRASVDFWKDMPRRDRVGLWFDPVQDEENPGHFKTLIQMLKAKDESIIPDGNIPDVMRCKEPECLYNFKSIADVERHMIIIHGSKGSQVNPFGFNCKYQDKETGSYCNENFKTRHFLRKHKVQKSH